MKYLKLLENSYANKKEDLGESELSRLEFISDHIFNFQTYDANISEVLAKKSLSICEAISSKSTYEYIKEEENYLWYITILNMPFFVEKIDWGCSIRGAWWDILPYKPLAVESCALYEGDKQLLEISFVMESDWVEFIIDMIEWSKPQK